MTMLTATALFFAGLHLLVSGTALRDVLVRRLGENAYRAAFSLASALGLAALIWAFARARVPMPSAGPAFRGIADLLLLPAFVLIAYGVMVKSPTLVGGERLLRGEIVATGMQRVTRHPMLWGVALWAALHMLLNRDAVNLLFFGTFLVVAVAGTFSIDAKRARSGGEGWARFTGQTSNLPFQAIVQGRNRLVWREFALLPLAVGVGAYVVLLMLHARFFGLPPY
jgi:uncharacterized membrane protein